MNFKLKLAKIDIFIISILTVLSLVLGLFIYFVPKDSGKSVAIYIEGKMEYSLSLEEDQTLALHPGEYNKSTNTYPSLLGEMVIEIKDKSVRVEKEDSPLHVCSKQGWVSVPNFPVTCAPNYVVVVIESADATNFDFVV